MDEPLLGIDGALGNFSAALSHRGRLTAMQTEGQAALEGGLPLLDRLLAGAGLRLRDLGGLAVCAGPGSFTGLRITIAYAKSLALGAGLPLVGVAAFDVVEEAGADGPLCLAIVTGRPGVICARLRGPGLERTACGRIGETLDRLLGEGAGPITVAGATEDVLDAVRERVSPVLVSPAAAHPPALSVVRLALRRAPASSLHAVRPDYGELPAAVVRATADRKASL